MYRRALFLLSLLPMFAASHNPTLPEPRQSPVLGRSTRAVGQAVPNRYIVVLRPSVANVAGEAAAMTLVYRGRLLFVYEHALHGFPGPGFRFKVPPECIVDPQVVDAEGMLHGCEVADLVERLPAGELRLRAELVPRAGSPCRA